MGQEPLLQTDEKDRVELQTLGIVERHQAHGGRVFVESPPRTQPAACPRHFTGSKFVLEIPVQPGAGRSPPTTALG